MGSRRLQGTLNELRASPSAIPGLLLVAALIALGSSEEGFFPTHWLPAGLFTLALLATSLLTISTPRRLPLAIRVATVLLAAYTAWSYLSILWATDKGVAWEGANRTLFYVGAFALLALWPLRRAAAATVLGTVGLGIGGLGVVTLLRTTTSGDASSFFVAGRLIEPLGYTNANVALWFLGFLPCVVLSARREVPPAIRAATAGGAGILVGLALLGQSRGWLYTLPLTLLLFILVVPGRGRNLIALLAVGAATAVSSGPILDVLTGIQAGDPPERLLQDASRAIFLGAAALAAVALAAAYADNRIALSERAARRVRAGIVGTAAAAVAAALVLALVVAGDPVARVADAWDEFKAGGAAAQDARLSGSLGTNRYDFWRVALSQFADAPIHGAGMDNFQNAYLARGESLERPRYVHSFELAVLSETGLVGAVLLVGGIGAALLAGLRAARTGGIGGAVAGAAVAAVIYWLVHGSVDWFWEFPAVGALAFAMLGLAASLAPREQPDSSVERGRPLLGGRLRPAVALPFAVALLLALLLPWIARLEVKRATEAWPANASAAFQRLERASELDPLSTEPASTAGAIALRLERAQTAEDAFMEVVDRNPGSAYGMLLLGALASELGRPGQAIARLEAAARLSPRDELIRDALRRVRDGVRLDASAVYDQVLERRAEKSVRAGGSP